MKKHILIIFFVFLLFTKTSEAQKNYLEFNVSPYSLLDPTHPQFRVGSEICLFNFLLIGSDVGIGFTPNYKISFLSVRDYKKYNFRQIRPTIKFINNNSKKVVNFYFGFEYFYMQENNIILNEKFYVGYNGIISYSEANYFRQKEGLHLLIGAKIFLYKNMTINLYFGGGVARKYANISNLKNPIYQTEYTCVTFGGLFRGYTEMPHFALNLKFAWQFEYNKHNNNK